MTEHILKTWPMAFEAIASGAKRFEWRKDDRGFSVGDVLVLQEWDPVAGHYVGQFNGLGDWSPPELRMHVTYLLRGDSAGRPFGVPEGYCIMSIEPEKGTEQVAPEPAQEGDGLDISFGCDPGDSVALEKLRMAIDDNLIWPSEVAEEAGDYEAAVRHSGALRTENEGLKEEREALLALANEWLQKAAKMRLEDGVVAALEELEDCANEILNALPLKPPQQPAEVTPVAKGCVCVSLPHEPGNTDPTWGCPVHGIFAKAAPVAKLPTETIESEQKETTHAYPGSVPPNTTGDSDRGADSGACRLRHGPMLATEVMPFVQSVGGATADGSGDEASSYCPVMVMSRGNLEKCGSELPCGHHHPVAKAEAPSESAGWVPKVGDRVVVIDFGPQHGKEFPVHAIGGAGAVRVKLDNGDILSLLPSDVAAAAPAQPQPQGDGVTRAELVAAIRKVSRSVVTLDPGVFALAIAAELETKQP